MNLQKRFKDEISKKAMESLGVKNQMQTPRLTKIVVNIGLGEALNDKKVITHASQQLAIITGQKPLVTKAKRAISSFKLRAGMPVGLKVTLRGRRMYDFFEKLVSIVLTRMRDFRGVPLSGLDNSGNYSLGFSEQIVFPEIEYGKIDKIRGLEMTFVTTAQNKDEAKVLLKLLGMPFEKEDKNSY